MLQFSHVQKKCTIVEKLCTHNKGKTMGRYNSYDGSKKTSLFDVEVESRDFLTGEITRATKAKVVKKDKTPSFIMLFTAGTPILRDAGLTKSSEMVLGKILEKWVLNNNRVDLSASLRQYIEDETGYRRTNVYKAFRQLKEKKILVQDKEGTAGDKIKDAWYLNPFIFGKGQWNDVKKLRYDLKVEFDFEALEASSEFTRYAEYDDIAKLKNGDMKVVDGKIAYDEATNTTDAEFLVDEDGDDFPLDVDLDYVGRKSIGYKDEDVIDYKEEESEQLPNTQTFTGQSSELELLREQNKQLELKNKQLELENKQLELKIKAKELNI